MVPTKSAFPKVCSVGPQEVFWGWGQVGKDPGEADQSSHLKRDRKQ